MNSLIKLLAVFTTLLSTTTPEDRAMETVVPFQASYYEAPCEPGPARSIPSKLYRDSTGRIRIDRYVGIGSERFLMFRRIYDPAQNAMFLVNDTGRTVKIVRHEDGQRASVIGLFPVEDHSTQKDLGTKKIEGLVCRGYALGASTEYWISDELGIPILASKDAEVRMKITDIELIEPAPDLFTIPEDYKVEEKR